MASMLSLNAADFTVTSTGSSYIFNGTGNNPTLTLVRGRTYTFAINTGPSHPFRILNSAGVINNNIPSGTLTYTVPNDVANYTYDCSIHGFGGTIITIAPPVPPRPRILKLTLGTNIALKFTGSNAFSYFPEFNTNLTSTNWFALTVQSSNITATGTNDVFCGLPPGTNVFLRLRAQ